MASAVKAETTIATVATATSSSSSDQCRPMAETALAAAGRFEGRRTQREPERADDQDSRILADKPIPRDLKTLEP